MDELLPRTGLRPVCRHRGDHDLLAHLARFTRDPLQREAVKGAIRHAEESVLTLDSAVRPSFYSGLTGVAYALAVVGQLTGREEMVYRGLDLAAGLRHDEPQGHLVNILAGSAGTIQALVHLARRYRRDDLLGIAQARRAPAQAGEPVG